MIQFLGLLNTNHYATGDYPGADNNHHCPILRKCSQCILYILYYILLVYIVYIISAYLSGSDGHLVVSYIQYTDVQVSSSRVPTCCFLNQDTLSTLLQWTRQNNVYHVAAPS